MRGSDILVSPTGSQSGNLLVLSRVLFEASPVNPAIARNTLGDDKSEAQKELRSVVSHLGWVAFPCLAGIGIWGFMIGVNRKMKINDHEIFQGVTIRDHMFSIR